jgi:hypothetical protein
MFRRQLRAIFRGVFKPNLLAWLAWLDVNVIEQKCTELKALK